MGGGGNGEDCILLFRVMAKQNANKRNLAEGKNIEEAAANEREKCPPVDWIQLELINRVCLYLVRERIKLSKIRCEWEGELFTF